MSRNTGQQHPMGGPAPNQPEHNGKTSRRSKSFDMFKKLRVASVVLLFSITVILVALIWFFVIGSPKAEKSYVDNGRYQAIFLNGGQVYFGKIRDLNDKYVRVTDIFYLRVNQVVQPDQEGNNSPQTGNDISLVKLGCELHRPENEMLINREQVVFWENLKDESGENTVPGAVKKYLEQFPNGQECQSAASGNNNNTTTPSSNSNNTSTGTDANGTSNIDASTNQ